MITRLQRALLQLALPQLARLELARLELALLGPMARLRQIGAAAGSCIWTWTRSLPRLSN